MENTTYYKLEHIADMESGEIIVAHMHQKPLKNVHIPKTITMALIDTKGNVIEGKLLDNSLKLKPGYFHHNNYNILISDAPREHLNVRYVVLQTTMPLEQIEALKSLVLQMILTVFFLVIVVAWILSKLFMKPVRERVLQIEHFINDITHELNTPITSLNMSAKQALKQKECTTKTLNNISISTKQLYDIYRSLTYLNFKKKEENKEVLQLDEILLRSIEYYRNMAEIKHIDFNIELEPTTCIVPENKMTLLFGNLIGNAIKYSSRKSTIQIRLKNRVFTIKDKGIGIEKNKQKEIFKKFKRVTNYSGGFGVGLSIVKSICDEYNIKIELDSDTGKGTEFRLYL